MLPQDPEIRFRSVNAQRASRLHGRRGEGRSLLDGKSQSLHLCLCLHYILITCVPSLRCTSNTTSKRTRTVSRRTLMRGTFPSTARDIRSAHLRSKYFLERRRSSAQPVSMPRISTLGRGGSERRDNQNPGTPNAVAWRE